MSVFAMIYSIFVFAFCSGAAVFSFLKRRFGYGALNTLLALLILMMLVLNVADYYN